METREIPLTRGLVAIVDAADYEWLSQWKWHASRSRGNYYASSRVKHTVKSDDKHIGKLVKMHRLIMGVTDPKVLVDHKNQNTLDYRRSNLRVATYSQNSCNRGPNKNSKSGIKGVSQRNGAWVAQISIGGKKVRLGTFASKEAAGAAYNQAAASLHGEFAHENENVFQGDIIGARKARIAESGFRGVVKFGAKCYVARINHLGKRQRIGTFTSAEEAARAYNIRVFELYGDKATLNNVEPLFPLIALPRTDLRTTNSSGFRGVCWNKRRVAWMSQISKDGKYYCIGYFDTPEAAARAYDKKALELYGDKAKINGL